MYVLDEMIVDKLLSKLNKQIKEIHRVLNK